ncbi:MAG: DUF5110 domain-containing protein [Lachnospiraceae bacterium]|nr:DUF5110 domain-containing protein [Lachnospiraceae bacterium]
MKYELMGQRCIRFTDGKKEKYLEAINKGLVRIYEKKNSEDLVKLTYTFDDASFEFIDDKSTNKKAVFDFGKYTFEVGEDLLIKVREDKVPYFEECLCKETGRKSDADAFDIAVLEGAAAKEKGIEKGLKMGFCIFDGKDRFYGLGDKAAQLNRRGYDYISWNSDDPTQHNETYKSLYKSVNYVMVNHHSYKYYGVFYPSSYKCTFNLGKESDDFWSIETEKGQADYFLILGENPQQITKTYAGLVGKTLFPPFKMLGYQQSRWSFTEEEARNLVKNSKKYGLPLDYIVFDIDYMDNYKVYTVSEKWIKDMKALSDEFAAEGVGIITIIDPAVKLEKGYPLYDLLVKEKGFATFEGEEYVNRVWPGDAKYPNYFDKKTADIIAKVSKDYMKENGVACIWTDMNEPASFNGPLPDKVEFKTEEKTYYHDEVHNLYAEYMVRAISKAFTEDNKRPALVTRAGFATTAQFTTSWNGDNMSLWTHLAASLPQVATMNICNFAMNGVDIGGFNCDTTKELLIRWLEANLFSPFFRNHSSIGTLHQEPFSFDEETREIYKKMLDIRYSFTPYLYDLLHRAHECGEPVIRPLFYEYPLDEKCKECNDEIFVGGDILFAPIVNQGATSRMVYLPEGNWVDFFTGKIYEGGKEYIFSADFSETIILIKTGAVIPMFKNVKHLNKKDIDTLYLYFAPFADGEKKDLVYELYEDDGETLDYEKGIYSIFRISRNEEGTEIEQVKADYPSDYKKVVIIENGEETEADFYGSINRDL